VLGLEGLAVGNDGAPMSGALAAPELELDELVDCLYRDPSTAPDPN
jgi:hypothetical protein